MNRSGPSKSIQNSDRRLSSWKEIAQYLGRGVRTVQRWHSTLALPVHSVSGKTRSKVFAYKAELDRWLQECAERDEIKVAIFGEERTNNPRVLRNQQATKKMASLASKQYDQVARIGEEVRRMLERQKQRQKALMRSPHYGEGREQLENTGFTFLISDLELALTLTQIAANSRSNEDKRKRNQQNARRAYDTITKLARRAVLTDIQRSELDNVAARLKSRLETLGEVF